MPTTRRGDAAKRESSKATEMSIDNSSFSSKDASEKAQTSAQSTPAIVFFHPDLGIGGAERLVVDAAVGLQRRGRRVVIFTQYCNPGHCFEEARDGTLDVRVRGNVLPATILGRFKILLTILRHYHLLFSIALSGELRSLNPQAFFADQLSAGLPLLRFLYPDIRIIFYCHFPDLLLVQRRDSWLKKVWRLPFDAIEGWSMRGADRVVVNSKFTKSVVQGVWSGLGGEHGLGVVYPCVDVKQVPEKAVSGFPRLWGGKEMVLSINRFEKKKDVGLAIRAFAKLGKRKRKDARLVIAGGYDERERENVSCHEELVALATSLGLSTATPKNIASEDIDAEVVFLLSIPAKTKEALLRNATLLLYTPANEHFGIVPLEAMLSGVPVLATTTGGPLETVVDGKTGWLRDPADVDAWAAVLDTVIGTSSAKEVEAMGAAGRERVLSDFSEEKMASTLDYEIQQMLRRARVRTLEIRDIFLGFSMLGAVMIGVAGMTWRSGLFVR